MKLIKILPFIGLFLLASCSAIKVEADYDTSADFSQYKTYAFYKKGIEKVDISDLDKRRIINAIKEEMMLKGFTTSKNPDIVINIFAKSTKKVNVYNDIYGGFFWQPYYYYGPFYGMNYGTQVSQYDEGTLFIDFIDNNKKELIWQGVGKGALNMNDAKKKDLIVKEFVKEIIAQYPPEVEK